ncbi:MAG TPA: ABC transporter permease [Thermoanaerobaculia bacterium]|nr:ABC transporter permease [Thermoanaerobaculia bacterium]
MDHLIQDLRFSLRVMLKSPGVTLIAVLCIALGIAANTTIFSVVNAILLRPLPYADPERIAVLYETQLQRGIEEDNFSLHDLQDARASVRSFSKIEAYGPRSLVFSGHDEPERVLGALVSANLFEMLGEKPIHGRLFLEEEDRPGAPGVILLSHALWQRRFNSDPKIVGQTVMVNATAHTVVGVMAPHFNFPYQQEAWVPATPILHKGERVDRSLVAMARLRPGATFEQANVELEGFFKRLEREYPDSHAGWSARAVTLREDFVDTEIQLMVLTMMGAVICVLLIACANVANLLLARATARQREIAVRVAFGAQRRRVIRQLLTESVVVALVGGALGILLAVWGIHLMEAAIPQENQPPYWMRFVIDGNVLLFTLGIAVVTGLVFGLAPALQAAKTDLNDTLKEGGRGAGGSVLRNRLRNGLVIVEVALSLLLLVGASLFIRSFLELQSVDSGFDTRPLLTMRMYLPSGIYAQEDEAAMTRRIEDVVRRIEEIPAVEAAASSPTIPLSGGGDDAPVEIEGRPAQPGKEPMVFYTGVTSRFFETLGISLVKGRGFTEPEGAELSRVAVVNESFAQRFWPKREAVGRRFRFPTQLDPEKAGWFTVIGVVPDLYNDEADDKPLPSAYLPGPYYIARNPGILVRTRLDPAQVTAQVREAIRASDPHLPVYDILTMEEVRQLGSWQYSFLGKMFTSFGVIALFLASIGVYGVLSYSVSQRLREIGVRVALGAQRGDVVRLVLRQGMGLALGGIALGLFGALGVTRVVSGILYNVSATDPVSFGGISVLLATVAGIASYLPASRAMAVDPLDALRSE